MLNQIGKLEHPITSQQLIQFGLSKNDAEALIAQLSQSLNHSSAISVWQYISKEILKSQFPFELHLFLFNYLFPNWQNHPGTAPAWIPSNEFIQTTNLAHSMQELKLHTYAEFHAWSLKNYEQFWEYVIQKLNINFNTLPERICDLTPGIESPQWLKGAKLNIIDSCFNAPANKTAILFQNENGVIEKITYDQLNRFSNQIANSLLVQDISPGDAVAIDMPMTHIAVAIYLGIIKMGGIVVSIADSFSADEIATRLRIAKAKAIFTQDYIVRNSKKIPLYEKVVAAQSPKAIVLPCKNKLDLTLRQDDIDWKNFLVKNENFQVYACDPMSPCNILFSSGTTSEPKAIPWNHTTPIKVASDAFFHQNIQDYDILTWPTNLGWMMGPWVIFAALINQATLALYDGLPRDCKFGQFIQDAKVTFLGVVPTLVASWRQSRCMEGLDWRAIKTFSSTGECSNPEDMFYLMSLANYKPIIEYCGGTEIGGAYITSTVIQNNYPSVCTTSALGLDFTLLTHPEESEDVGEVALIPPSIGLSTELLNANHHKIYYADMPKKNDGTILRRHGDQLRHLPSGYYCILGRADDTMNLGGIKISSAEIERVISGVEDINETAAIAVTPKGHGPSQLVIFASTQKELDQNFIKTIMQDKINQHLNPLFKISEVKFVKELPKTASNKIMRRTLRKQCESSHL